jgi:predicted metal-dependent hydrolase
MPTSDGCERCADEPTPGVLHGIALFNRGEYFECHEVLEAEWNAERGEIRTLYKGILQIGVGCYHLLRHNYIGAMAKLGSGADYSEPFAPVCLGIAVGELIADARRLRAAVEAAGPAGIATVDRALLPIVRLVDAPSS